MGVGQIVHTYLGEIFFPFFILQLSRPFKHWGWFQQPKILRLVIHENKEKLIVKEFNIDSQCNLVEFGENGEVELFVDEVVMGSGSKSRVRVGFVYQNVRFSSGFVGFWHPNYITIDGFGSGLGTQKVGFPPGFRVFKYPNPSLGCG